MNRRQDILGKKAPKNGITPAIVLDNPNFPHNVGAALRAASCFGVKQVWFTGDRVATEIQDARRVPREERMKGFGDVELINFEYPLERFAGATPVAVELRQGSELLPQFVHPDNAVYVFGPEDGSVSHALTRHCHRFVVIPTRHCTNLSAAVYLLLYDRMLKRQMAGIDPILPMSQVLAEQRGPVCQAGTLHGHGRKINVEI